MPKSTHLFRYLAFLRGINVGGHRVTMERLRSLFGDLKLANATTFIASGNVIFDSKHPVPAELERRIEACLRRSLGYEVATFIRTPGELADMVAHRPFTAADMDAAGNSLQVGMLKEPLPIAIGQLVPGFRTARDEFHVRGRELYWLSRGKLTESLVSWPKWEKSIQAVSTMRNITTLRKLCTRYPAAP